MDKDMLYEYDQIQRLKTKIRIYRGYFIFSILFIHFLIYKFNMNITVIHQSIKYTLFKNDSPKGSESSSTWRKLNLYGRI